MAHMLNIQGLEEEENLLHPFFPPFKLAGREGLSFLHQFPASQGGMQAPFLLLPGWSPFSLYLVWRLTQGMGLQNCDLLLLRHKEELVPERCIGDPWYFCVLFNDWRGKAKRLWSLLCCESDRDKWHRCFCYL